MTAPPRWGYPPVEELSHRVRELWQGWPRERARRVVALAAAWIKASRTPRVAAEGPSSPPQSPPK